MEMYGHIPDKGPSKNVNIFMSVQTAHFLFQTPPLQVYRPTFLNSKIWVSRCITFIVQQQKLTSYFKPV